MPSRRPPGTLGFSTIHANGPPFPPHISPTMLTRSAPPRRAAFCWAPAPAARNGHCASPPKRLPLSPLRAGLPPRCIRHWRRSAPAVRNGRCPSPPKRLPSSPLLSWLPPRYIRHWRRSALAPQGWLFPSQKSVRPAQGIKTKSRGRKTGSCPSVENVANAPFSNPPWPPARKQWRKCVAA